MKSRRSKMIFFSLMAASILVTPNLQGAANARSFPNYKYKYVADHLPAEDEAQEGISHSAIKKGEVVESEFLRFIDKEHRAIYHGLGAEGKRLARTIGAEELKESSAYSDPNFNKAVEKAREEINQKAMKTQNHMLHNGMERSAEKTS